MLPSYLSVWHEIYWPMVKCRNLLDCRVAPAVHRGCNESRLLEDLADILNFIDLLLDFGHFLYARNIPGLFQTLFK
jgi:hypothetical protein